MPGRFRKALLAAGVFTAATACDRAPTAAGPAAVATPPAVLHAARDTVDVGARFRVVPIGASGDTLDPLMLAWTTSADTVATVDAAGNVETKGPGATLIVASGGGASASLLVVVQRPVVRIVIDPSDTTLHVGDQTRLIALALDQNGRPVAGPETWTLSDSSLLRVSSSGWATALKAGTLQVIAARDSFADTARVTILPVGPPASLWVMPDSDAVLVGDTLAFVAEARDSVGALIRRPISWSVSDPSVASIDTLGHLIGRSLGTVTVSATIDGLTRTTPLRVSDQPLRFTSLATGLQHTCGATADGVAYCWGYNSDGQLGRRVPEACSQGTAPFVFECSPRPVRVQTDVRFTSLAASGFHTCGVSTAGEAWCWGRNTTGQLGTGDFTSPRAPVRVATSLRFRSLTAGDYHTCGIATDDGLYCWGYSAYGAFGGSDAVPARVAPALTFRSVAATTEHTCGVATDGAVWCWGISQALGGGTADSTCELYGAAMPCATAPVRVATDSAFASIAVAAGITCGLTPGGSAYCWGWNDYGQLGDGTTTWRSMPVPVAGDTRFTELALGALFVCGRAASGSVLCWGRNAGTFGDGSSLMESHVPVSGASGLTAAGLWAGLEHACALTAGGVARCWGRDWQGQLGNGVWGRGLYSLVPTEVRGAR